MQVGDNQYRKEEKRIFHNQEKEKYNIYDKIKTDSFIESYNKSQTDESKKIEREMELEATY